VIDRTSRTVALLRFAENELKRQAEAGVSDDYRRRVAKTLRDVRAIMDEIRDSANVPRPKMSPS
jgi:uncharacterized protein with von Willebrand factor type A (vWA) domain